MKPVLDRPAQDKVVATAHLAALELNYAKADKAYCVDREKLAQDQQVRTTREEVDLAKAKAV